MDWNHIRESEANNWQNFMSTRQMLTSSSQDLFRRQLQIFTATSVRFCSRAPALLLASASVFSFCQISMSSSRAAIGPHIVNFASSDFEIPVPEPSWAILGILGWCFILESAGSTKISEQRPGIITASTKKSYSTITTLHRHVEGLLPNLWLPFQLGRASTTRSL